VPFQRSLPRPGVFALPLGPSTATSPSSGTLRNRTVRCGECLEPKHWCIVLWSADGAALVLPRHPRRHLCIDTAINTPPIHTATNTKTATNTDTNMRPHCDTLLLCTSSDVCCCHLLTCTCVFEPQCVCVCVWLWWWWWWLWWWWLRWWCVCVCVCSLAGRTVVGCAFSRCAL
jgi:hypothetical protein